MRGSLRLRIRSRDKQVRVHDLKHTFGRRLRAAGVRHEDIQDLLGHKTRQITTHYSAAELHNLIAAANKVDDSLLQSPVLTMLRVNRVVEDHKNANPHNFPTGQNYGQSLNLAKAL